MKWFSASGVRVMTPASPGIAGTASPDSRRTRIGAVTLIGGMVRWNQRRMDSFRDLLSPSVSGSWRDISDAPVTSARAWLLGSWTHRAHGFGRIPDQIFECADRQGGRLCNPRCGCAESPLTGAASVPHGRIASGPRTGSGGAVGHQGRRTAPPGSLDRSMISLSGEADATIFTEGPTPRIRDATVRVTRSRGGDPAMG